jgi:uncharacterized damage-inducible protein DinB
MKPETLTVIHKSLAEYFTSTYPKQVRDCLDKLTDEQIWWRPNEQSNAVGNLVLHLSGGLTDMIARQLGGFSYQRNRDSEFSERGPIPKAQLLKTFNDTISKIEQTLTKLEPSRLETSLPEPNQQTLVIQLLLRLVTHFNYHVGQIIYVTKMLTGDKK